MRYCPNKSLPPPRRHAARGFTLLEIILAMSIVAILSGVGTVLFKSWKSQKALEESLAGIESCARVAYSGILHDQRPWMVVFNKTRCSTHDIGGLPPEGEDLPKAIESYTFPEDQILLVKRTTWSEWKEIVIPEPWRLEPRSILEPLEVRIESPKGWIQGRFDPLTARITDIEMEAN